MRTPLIEKKFEARIPISLWERYERWAEGRKINNAQLATALLRLFLSSPEWLKLVAMFGRAEDLNVAGAFEQIYLEGRSAAADQVTPSDDDRLAAETVRRALADEAAQHGRKGAAPAADAPDRKARGRRKSG